MQNIPEFFEALKNDSTFRQKISSAATASEAVVIAKDFGLAITEADLVNAYRSKMHELSEDQLAAISGGKGKTMKNSPGISKS
tara:strand:- start:518 stop:766 length:249 start_codon:yes stop_codon:yes gene_type:complete